MKATRIYTRISVADRLHAKLQTMPNGCIEFMGSRRRFGYGQIAAGGQYGRTVSAHRVAWELVYGPIPDGMFICHQCDNPPCCNVDHLFLGTNADNVRDMREKGRASLLPCRYGEKHHNATASDAVVRQCRDEYAAGIPAKQIALHHDLPYRLVWTWVTGRSRAKAG